MLAHKSFNGTAFQNLLIGWAFVTPTCFAYATEVYVTDGDTIHVGAETYRLEGIDAPETKQSCLNSKGKEFRCGLAATRVMRQLVEFPNVNCSSSGRDRYGRNLGHCTSNGIDINQAMVDQGYARAFVKYSSEYIASETEAKNAKRGLWAGQWQAPWQWRADQLSSNSQGVNGCVIKGNRGKRGNIYYLPFQSAYNRVKIDVSKGERWFCTEDEAMKAGWTRAH